MNRVRNPVWISCTLKKKILPGACIFSRLQYNRDYGVLPLLIANPWIALCYSQFYILYWHSSSVVSVFCMMFAYISQWRHQRRTQYNWHFFVYHACKKVRITYRSVINWNIPTVCCPIYNICDNILMIFCWTCFIHCKCCISSN